MNLAYSKAGCYTLFGSNTLSPVFNKSSMVLVADNPEGNHSACFTPSMVTNYRANRLDVGVPSKP